MSNILRICFVVVAFLASSVLNSFVYAGTITRSRDVRLDCAKSMRKPTVFAVRGKPDMTLSVKSKGLLNANPPLLQNPCR